MAFLFQRASFPAIGRKYLVWFTIVFILGIFFGFRSPFTDSHWLTFTLILLVVIGIAGFLPIFLFLQKHFPLRAPDFLLVWFILLAFLLGVFRVHLFDSVQYQSLRETAGTDTEYIGVLTDNPTLSNTGKTYGFPVKVLAANQEGTHREVNGTIRLYAPLSLSRSLTRGDTISFSACLEPPSNAPFSGGFSTKDYLYRQNCIFQEYTETLTKTSYPYHPSLFQQFLLLGEVLRDKILFAIDQSFAPYPEEGALLKGILLGIQEDFTHEQYQDFVDSGLLHITSVSGMHVMFLSGFFLFFLQKFQASKRLINLILLPVLLLFASVSALTPSVCRSTIMTLLFFLAQWVQQEPDNVTSLSLSAVILLGINPYTLTSYSFLLSFSSTLGIIAFSSSVQCHLTKLFRSKGKEERPTYTPKPLWRKFLVDPICSSLSMTFGCLLGMGFFGARFFRRFSWGSFPANLCLLPFAASSFLLGLLLCILFYLFPALAAWLAAFPLRGLLWSINRIAGIFSHTVFRIPVPALPVSAFLPYLIFCVALYFTIKPKMPQKEK